MITESDMLQGRKFYIEGTFYPFWTSTLQVFAPFDTSAATLKKQGVMSVFAWQSMLLVGLVMPKVRPVLFPGLPLSFLFELYDTITSIRIILLSRKLAC